MNEEKDAHFEEHTIYYNTFFKFLKKFMKRNDGDSRAVEEASRCAAEAVTKYREFFNVKS